MFKKYLSSLISLKWPLIGGIVMIIFLSTIFIFISGDKNIVSKTDNYLESVIENEESEINKSDNSSEVAKDIDGSSPKEVLKMDATDRIIPSKELLAFRVGNKYIDPSCLWQAFNVDSSCLLDFPSDKDGRVVASIFL